VNVSVDGFDGNIKHIGGTDRDIEEFPIYIVSYSKKISFKYVIRTEDLSLKF